MPLGATFRTIIAAGDGGGGGDPGETAPYRKQITVESSQVTANQNNFPILLQLASDADLAARATADDIYVTESDGETTVPHEIEYYDAATGQLSLWFKGTISASVDTTFYLYYGNAGASPGEDAANVWDSNFKSVLHFAEETLPTPDGSNPIFLTALGPKVVKDPVSGDYYLFYNTSAGDTRDIHYATASSIDGTFTAQGLALDLSSNGGHSHDVLHDPVTGEAIAVEGTYYMFFTQGTFGGTTIGVATASSLAGPWTVDTDNSPVLEAGSASEWDETAVGVNGIDVFEEGGTYYMLYEGHDGTYTGGTHQIGLATSNDLLAWTKSGSNPVVAADQPYEEGQVEYPSVRKVDSTYVVLYTGGRFQDFDEVLALATGASLTSLTKSANNPIAVPQAGWEAEGISDGNLIIEGGTAYIIYEGEGSGGYEIGRLSTSDILTVTGSYRDSTGGTRAMPWALPTSANVGSNVGRGIDLNGTSQYLEIPTRQGDDLDALSPFTIEIYVDLDTNNDEMLWARFAWYNNRDLGMYVAGASSRLQFNGSNVIGTTIGTGQHHVVVTYSGTAFALYVDGASVGTHSASITPASTNEPWMIGTDPDAAGGGGLGNWTNGRIDEVRFSSVARDGDYVATVYNNLSAPGTFIVLGSEEEL